MPKHIIKTKIPWIPNGFTLESHHDNGEVDLSKLALHLEPEQEKGTIKGEVLAERMKEKGLNSAVLKYLSDNPKLIPDDWKGKLVYFWGTILRNPHGYRYVLYLYWHGDEWNWDSDGWLVSDWDAASPSAVLTSLPSKSLSLKKKRYAK